MNPATDNNKPLPGPDDETLPLGPDRAERAGFRPSAFDFRTADGGESRKSKDESRPKEFAGYHIESELGRGGMGRVYKALDREINEEVAIKLLKPEIASDESTVDRFRNELKFARKIAHKNVCKMYHLAKEEETPYITMEYVSGEDLSRRVGVSM